MADKQILIKVKVEGKEVQLTSKQLELFKKNAEGLRKELDSLGQRTEENSEKFDKLTGDLEKLDQVLNQTKQESKEAADGIEDLGDQSEESGNKVKSLRAQLSEARNALAALGPRTADNADKFDDLTSKVQSLSESYEDVQFGTKKLDDALGALPGPIGQAASGFKAFDDGLKNVRSALGTLTRQFPILKNAIAATGIGALVVLFGLLVAAVVKAFNSFKPLQDAVGKLGVAFDLVMKLTEPLIELIGKGLTIALEALAKAIAFVTGNMDEYNKAVADKKATEDLQNNVKKQEELLDANGYKYDEFTKRKIQANIDYNKKKLELDADETKSEAEKLALLKQYRDKANNEINEADKDRAKKVSDAKKTETDKAIQIETDYQKRLLSVQNEYALLSIEDEGEKQRKQLEIQKDAQLKEINELKVSEKKKEVLRQQTLKNYELQLKIVNENIKKEQEKADKDLAKQTRDIKISMIEDEKERLKAEAEVRKNDALDAINEIKASEEAKAAARLAINEKYAQDIDKINKDITKKTGEEIFRQIEFERESRKLALENRLKEIDLSFQSELAKVNARRLVLQEQAKIDNEAEISNLRKLLEDKQITQSEFDEREKERKRQYELTLTQIELENINLRQQARQNEINAYEQLANSVVNLINVFQKQGQESEALVKIQQALTLATNIATLANNIQALSELGKGYGKQIGKASALPFPASIPAIAAVIASFVGVLTTGKQLFGIGKKGGASAASGGGQDLGRNYEEGGMINGPRHAQGGVMIEAEGGEAVMTRGAVTLFKPMLSMMNQMGGGTSFTPNLMTTSFDNPVVNNPAQSQEPMIIKTYVVSNELTTEAERQAKLKDLSTL
jgi:predicted  nucleic acid-binding Zn-ribbon protein